MVEVEFVMFYMVILFKQPAPRLGQVVFLFLFLFFPTGPPPGAYSDVDSETPTKQTVKTMREITSDGLMRTSVRAWSKNSQNMYQFIRYVTLS
jgi:hypothetical protein